MPDLLSKKDILDANINGLRSPLVVDFLMRITKIERLNKFYNKILSSSEGLEFIDAALEELNITIDFDEKELDFLPKKEPFIVIANHPFGMIDGVLMIHLIAKKRPEIKVLANFLLERILPLKQSFIGVNPFEKQQMNSILGIKRALKHLQEGNPIGIFPAGEVSSIQDKRISDKEWDKTAIKLIQKAKVPVVPMYFDGNNSRIFHLLGMINPNFRTASLASELFKKQDQTIPIRLGKPISEEEIANFTSSESLSRYLRTRVYALGAPLGNEKSPLKILQFFKPKNLRNLIPPSKIIDAVDKDLLEQEIQSLLLQEKKITERSHYQVFAVRAQYIPNLMREIARLREITFREVGEGTNRKMDIDEYDLHYHQLFVWDTAEKAIVGAYRLGVGSEIIPRYGKNGLYTSSLFNLDDRLEPMLAESLEMGRSFVVKAYQAKPFSLFLLLQGIFAFVEKNPQLKYVIGPVSISNEFSKFSKQLIISFLQKYHYNYDLARYITPKKGFRVKYKHDTNIILDAVENDIELLDKIISEIEPGHLHIPVLLKKYIADSAQILCFSVDPNFNNALDGFMLLKLEDLPMASSEFLSKSL